MTICEMHYKQCFWHKSCLMMRIATCFCGTNAINMATGEGYCLNLDDKFTLATREEVLQWAGRQS